jgi:DNA polymerase V
VVVLSNNDGCIIARSDEAKAVGIKMGAPYFQCKSQIIENKVAVFSSNYQLYGELSMRVMDTLRNFVGAEKVEVYSVDEAFLQLAQVPAEQLSSIASGLKQRVETWTGIRVSVGIAPTKVLAKLANRLAKKNKQETRGALVLEKPAELEKALKETEIGEVWGIGHQYAEKLRRLGISDALKFSRLPINWVQKNMGGVVGVRLHKELNGIPCIDLKDPLEKKKMIGSSRMFGRPVYELEEIREAVATYLARAAEKLRRQDSAATEIGLYVVAADENKFTYNPKKFSTALRLPKPCSGTNELLTYALPLLPLIYQGKRKYLKAGVQLSGLVPASSLQENLFLHSNESTEGHEPCTKKLMKALDNINFSQGANTIHFGATGIQPTWTMRQDQMSPRYTTSWKDLPEVE